MPRKAPAEPIDHHYNIPKLNRVFFISGIVLAVVFVGMVIEDYSRGWKNLQRSFMRLDAKKTREAIAAAREKAYGEEREKLRVQLAEGRQQIDSHKKELARLNAHLRKLDPQIYAADQDYKFAKASFDAERYRYEDALAHAPKSAPSAQKDLNKIEKKMNEAADRLAKLTRDKTSTDAEITRITKARDDTQTAIDKLSADYKLSRQKLATLKQDALFNARNSPILDMVNPSLRVQQVQLPEHYNDVNFMRIPRVDRCQTCHVGADRKGFEDSAREVFRTHSRQNLMVGSESPHPANEFGCTPCHGGRDRATSFWSAGHSPVGHAQEASWKKKYDWEFDRFNETPILPLQFAEGGCYRCHAEATSFPDAPKLNAGLKLIEGLGCWGCHRIEGLEKQGIPRVGPSLEKVAGKVTKDWATRWVMNPAAFRPSTKMPTFFYLENFVQVSGPKKPTPAQQKMNEQGRLENDTMVNAIVAYVFDKSHAETLPPAPGRGDAARGQKLIADRGCMGCHVIDPAAPRDLTGTYRQFGPNLAGVGSKVSRDWLFHWIKDPKAWNPETKMPNLRLSDSEALDIAEYLGSLKGPSDFESTPLPRTDPATLQRIAMYFEMANKTKFDSEADLAKMDLHGKEVYAGEKLIAHYCCYACHQIPGFADAKPIGTELTEEGSKAVHRLDFGFLHLDHTREAWFQTKLANPRIYDRDRARGWEEKLRMPNFRLSPREQEQVVTVVLGLQKLNASAAAKKELSPNEAAVEKGRRIVKNHNCRGCHILEGEGGSFRSLVADASLAPPIIQGEGAKVQSDWLFAFLRAPKTGQIRPWLEAHMPTFGFTEGELNDLTKYFAALDRAQYPFLAAGYPTDPRSWAAGKKTFELLKCKQCHPRSDAEMNAPGVDRATLAPNLQQASARLRHDWINDWIRRPDEWMPGTRMPTNFPKADDGKRTSPLGAMADAPAFAKDREEYARILGGDEPAKKFLADPNAVTKALRDYVWSIGINGGTGPTGPASAASASDVSGSETAKPAATAPKGIRRAGKPSSAPPAAAAPSSPSP
jgi:cytochrome c2